MSPPSVPHERLHNQRLLGAPFARPEDVVGWLCAVQAQDYAGATWGIGQRVAGASDDTVEAAFQRGTILRTHVLRPTWHFVLPADLRWLLALTAPRVHQLSAYYYRGSGLDTATFRRCHAVLAKALAGGKHLTRVELMHALARAGVRADGPRLGHIMMHAELDAVLCSGPRRGKQFTYALLDERVPAAARLPREEALAQLTRRYFTSHGPALVRDFAGWSSLTVADIERGLAMNARHLVARTIDGKSYWSAPPVAPAKVKVKPPVVRLLPNYDEYLIGYKDHGPTFTPAVAEGLRAARGILDRHIVVMNGHVIGGWRRTLARKAVHVETDLLVTLTPAERRALGKEIARYADFLGLPSEPA